MVLTHKVAGFEEFKSYVAKLSKNSAAHINVYFTGSKNAAGKSWCPDCNDAEPFVENAVKSQTHEDSHFVVVDVGDRAFWKDMKNPFRTDKDSHLSVIPTLVNWNEKAKRLEGDHLCKPELLEMFFEQE